jgi:hypothetical protein
MHRIKLNDRFVSYLSVYSDVLKLRCFMFVTVCLCVSWVQCIRGFVSWILCVLLLSQGRDAGVSPWVC